MKLTQKVAPTVPIRIRERGSDLYRQGAVYIYRGSEMEVHASVMGTRLYPVNLTREDHRLNMLCGCPYFGENTAVCKHIWAALLASDAAGYLSEDSDLDGPDRDNYRITNGPPTDEALHVAMDSFRKDSRSLVKRELWRSQLRSIQSAQERPVTTDKPWPANREILYVIDAQASASSGGLTLNIFHRQPKRDGSWAKPKTLALSPKLIGQVPDALDRQILSMALGTSDPWQSSYGYYGYGRDRSVSGAGLTVPASITEAVVRLICATNRGRVKIGDTDEQVGLQGDEGPPWELWLDVEADSSADSFWVEGRLKRDQESVSIHEPALLLAGGFVFWREGTVAALNDFGSFAWVSTIRKQGPMAVPTGDIDKFLQRLVEMPQLPRTQVPPALEFAEVQGIAQPRLQIAPRRRAGWGQQNLGATLTFRYEDQEFSDVDHARGVFKKNPRQLTLRDKIAERDALQTLMGLGLKRDGQGVFPMTTANMPRIVSSLTATGWIVEAQGCLYRRAGESRVSLSSGIDWFELKGSVQFGDQTAFLPQLLAAARRGEGFVRLGDGTIGLVPEEWLERYATVASLGIVEGNTLRFRRSQAGLLDALLAVQPEVNVDEMFVQVRDRLNTFAGVAPVQEPSGFQGKLRTYQREGLGWFGFLEEFGLGGCLADDMGLGKTVQVLALLEGRRQLREAGDPIPPTLIVVPKSLVFNWLQEAERFTPKMKILDHTGTRVAPGAHFEEYDVILTTYGTLRRDAAHLNEVTFDYAILDEAQAIKNAATASAKAARLLRANHRLALSGTPIENHLGELWSMFEFLNPGMLGGARAFASALEGRNPDPAARRGLAKALRPFILRRTKQQVAKDLPAKTEQTQFCELIPAQRKQYDELRDHYRRDLMDRVDRDGLSRSKIFVLEALLRLRQAACHPGLIDPARAGESSAKLDLLLPQLVEVADEGHKAIVFSQFTKMLGILRPKLDDLGIPYEYLDGRTRDRQARVESFQNDPDCRLFLISLKAGGLGLNLTAAEYVFLLDPWWNPAVEAQAIDRAHRIGQTRPVFAYRIIAKDTVEEKVLKLQDSKRALADAIIGADNSLIRQIGREDLELLLS